MFFRKKNPTEVQNENQKNKPQKSPSLQQIYTGMEENGFLLTDNFLYWKYRGKLAGTTADIDNITIRIDMDILDTWMYPAEYKKQPLTKEEVQRFQSDALRYLEENGYTAELEYSAQDSFANPKRYLGKRR